MGLAIIGPLQELDLVAYLRFASVYRAFDLLEDFEVVIAESKAFIDDGWTVPSISPVSARERLIKQVKPMPAREGVGDRLHVGRCANTFPVSLCSAGWSSSNQGLAMA